MGRFDALTQLEEPNTTPTPSPGPSSPAPDEATEHPPEARVHNQKKPENLNSRKPERESPPQDFEEKPEKYSTLLDPGLIKKIKLYAAERDIKDYEVLQLALTEYFKKQT